MHLELFSPSRLSLISGLFACVKATVVPHSPCPNTFRYELGHNGELYGTIAVYTLNDNIIRLNVELSVANHLNLEHESISQNYSGRIDLAYPENQVINDILNRKPVRYKLFFPPWINIPPKLTRISVNGQIVCTGPSIAGSRCVTKNPQSNVLLSPENFPILSAKESNSQPSYADICGVSVVSNPLVVNGNSVLHGTFPWLVALFRVTNTVLEYQCSGSLISKKHVLTAAHCVMKGHARIAPRRLVVLLGKHNLHTAFSEDEKMKAEDIKVHPEYAPSTSDADLAMIILIKEVQFTRYIRPICLWSELDDIDAVIGQKGKVVGWGKDENNIMTAEPKQITMPIVSQRQCLWSGEAFKYVTSSRTFCAGERNGAGPCNGDSGGGFIMRRNERWVLRGVVSISTYDHNTQSCDLSNYVVFTDISKFKTRLFSFVS
ncbi:Trypsin domain containing protein [Asbolus verrucosus]|uniref:Trypsin domain containing protein n=1 Tax=Asbolus verrucosus TaxID=1661398 RepID=A0A482W5W0_ASBVE|nr:Trypsin domain containing protein [Asbolus verrucosus]